MNFVDYSIGSHVKSQTPLGEEPIPSSTLHCSPPRLVFRVRAFTDENQIAKVHLRQLSPDLPRQTFCNGQVLKGILQNVKCFR